MNYNPFFIYGGVGLGKTHLMHAIGNKIFENSPQKKILYVSAEQFTGELITSIREHKVNAFKEKYRQTDEKHGGAVTEFFHCGDEWRRSDDTAGKADHQYQSQKYRERFSGDLRNIVGER